MLKIQFPKELEPFCIDINDIKIEGEIGSGGFGCVKKAYLNGKKIAIKTLTKEPKKSIVLRFISEVCALYRCHHPFIVKFIGFTNKNPYSIITEFVSNTNLKDFLAEKRFEKKRTGTNLTKIAMGIADAISYMHSLKLMHRDIKPDNILLDHDFNPKICDFGLVREFNKPTYPTFRIGTKYWMAPEIIRKESAYNEKCDVFSYGIVLYQMESLRMPYKEGKESVYDMIVSGKRPEIPSKTPHALEDLIRRCWDDDPKRRPSFSHIYKMFSRGEVFFGNTDSNEIEKYANFIEEKTVLPAPNPVIFIKQKRKNDQKYYSSIPFSDKSLRQSQLNVRYKESSDSSDSESSDKRTMHFESKIFKKSDSLSSDSYDEPVMNYFIHQSAKKGSKKLKTIYNFEPSSTSSEESFDNDYSHIDSPYYQQKKKKLNFSILKDPKNPHFESELRKIRHGISEENAKKFLRISSEYFKSGADLKTLKQILQKIAEILDTKGAIEEFEALKFKHLLPYEDKELIDPIMDILCIAFNQNPLIFQHNFKQHLKKMIDFRTEKSLLLLSFFAKEFDSIEDPWELLDLLIKKEVVFFKSNVGNKYIDLLFRLLTKYDAYYKYRIDTCQPIFVRFICSPDKSAAIEAYKAVTHLFNKSIQIPYEKVIDDLRSKEMSKFAISLLLKVKKLPTSQDMLFNLINLSSKNEKASLLILKLLCKQSNALSLADTSNWLSYNLPTKEMTLSIFLSVIRFEKAKSIIIEAPELPKFLLSILVSREERLIVCLPLILNIIEISRDLFKSLRSVGFFEEIAEVLLMKSENCRIACVHSFTIILSYFYVKETLKSMSVLIKYVNKGEKLAKATLKLFVKMSFYEKVAVKFKEMELLKTVNKAFNDNNSVQKYIKELKENILSFTE